MNALQSFHDLNDNLDSMFKEEDFARQFSLVSKKISLLAILHYDDNKIRS